MLTNIIKWFRKSLGRKAVTFVAVFVIAMSFGIFQLLFYASERGYLSSNTSHNGILAYHILDELPSDEMDYVCDRGVEFYKSHKDLYDYYTNDREAFEEEFRSIYEDERYQKLFKKAIELYNVIGTDLFRLVLVDYDSGTLFTFFTAFAVYDDPSIETWVTRVDPFEPVADDDPQCDYEFLKDNDFSFGKVNSVPHLIKKYENDKFGVYLFMDTYLEFSRFMAGDEIANTIVMMIVLTVILGILILILVNYTVVQPLNTLSEASRKLIRNLSSDEVPHVRVYDKISIDTGDEIEHLYNSVNALEEEIYNYMDRLKVATSEKERISTELDIAQGIQAHMLPSVEPDFTDREYFDLAASMHPAKEVGGDFYDFFMLSEDRLAFIIADVSGKGVPAALVMAIGKTMLKNFTIETGNIGDAFRIVNNLLLETNNQSMFITAFEGILNLRTGELLYANAGHEDPFIMRAGGTFSLKKEKHSIVLGAMEDMRYKVHSMKLEPGDRFYIYTDGVPEAQDIEYKMFGLERTCETLNSVRDKSAAEVIRVVKESIDAFVGEAPPFDDTTMLLLDFRKYFIE